MGSAWDGLSAHRPGGPVVDGGTRQCAVRRWATTRRVFTVTADVHPASTQFTIPNPGDRRYGGLLLGNLSLLSDTDRSRSVLMLSIGLIGPGAGAKDLQNGFHSLIGQQVVKD